MLTWDEFPSSRPRGTSVNKVIIVGPIGDNSKQVPFDENKRPVALKSLYESFLARLAPQPVYAAVSCAYAWLLNWVMQHAQSRPPVTPEHKTHRGGDYERPQHFFSASKLNMRNAP